ncbi:carboxylesterase family protein (plasmid) [Clostridium estertheticum]|nr:carboxylesterase family protein [Clostridium estertheticum]WLC86417.1 carboxylesterase family protein [Clostridium estertheticum]
MRKDMSYSTVVTLRKDLELRFLLPFLLNFTYPTLIDRAVITSGKPIPTETVKTENGLVSGVYNSDKSIKVFAGLPYATPPVGQLRWKAPQPPKSWNGVRTADHFSDCAMQRKTPVFASKLLALSLGTSEFDNSTIKNNEAVSEDCLYLNVWTGSKSTNEHRPVIVFIHGGSFLTGAGSIDAYNGEAMAKKGVVFVTLNYRLGIFGFMANPELTRESETNSSGNYGILDQVAALKWIKNNIAGFDGDPNNITIAGESAGSMCVNALVASPITKGLFQRAIGESGAIFGSRGVSGGLTQTLAQAEQAGMKFADSQKKASISDLRKMSSSYLLKVSKNLTTRPIIDGYLLPDTIYNIFAAGKQNDVPVIIGNNSDEGSLFLTLPWPMKSAKNADEFKSDVIMTYKDKADEFFKLYPSSTNSVALKSQLDSGRNQWFAWHMHTWANLQSQTGKSKVYYYYFDRVQPGPARMQKLGAYHSSEIAYAYSNLKFLGLPYADTDKNLSDTMSSYWINFATTGNPNGKGLPEWVAYDNQKDQTLELGANIHTISIPDKTDFKFFDSYEAGLREK